MKCRQGFVSNSSSSSFVIQRSFLSDLEISMLKQKCIFPIGKWKDSWEITLEDELVRGYTSMRNNDPNSNDGDLQDWMSSFGFPMELIVWNNH